MLSPTGQVEQLPVTDSIFNIGVPGLVVVTSNVITYSNTHMSVFAVSNQIVITINGGVANDLLYIRGTPGTSEVRFEKGSGNIFGGGNRKIKDFDQVLVLLNLGGSWVEVSWSG